MIKIFISVGDLSGDIHAARLMEQLKTLYSEIVFEGIGGENMERQGLKSIISLSKISVVGFLEVAKKLPFFLSLLDKSKKMLLYGAYDLVLTVDYPGFNLKLAKYAKSIGVKTCQYVAPQIWAWGKNRAEELKETIDLLLVVFPFEVEFFENHSINAEFVGHPLTDDPSFAQEIAPLTQKEKIIAFLPGSRIQEIKKHGQLFVKVAKRLDTKLKGYRFVVATTPNISNEEYKSLLNFEKFEFTNDSRSLMYKAQAGIVKTGTSTLEAALCGMPFTMIYKTSQFTYQYGKYVVNLPYLSLVNILKNAEIVKEYIQSEANVSNLENEILRIINDSGYGSKQVEAFKEIRVDLGESGTAKNAAKSIKKLLDMN